MSDIFIKKITSDLLEKFKTPSEWNVEEYWLIHIPSGSRIWIANGLFFLRIHTNVGTFNLIEKWVLWYAIKELINNIYSLRLLANVET